MLSLFPGVKIATLHRRKRMLKAAPTMSEGISLGLSGLERVSFDTRNFRAVVVGDFQSPFHNKEALKAFNFFLKDEAENLEAIINIGDHFDNYSISRYSKDKRRGSLEEWKKEKAIGLSIFEDWRKFYSKDILLLYGNHEDRWNQYVDNMGDPMIREAAGESLVFEKVYGLDKLDIITFPYMVPVTLGDVTITHGTRSNSTSPGATALKEIRTRFGTSVIVGHCHSGALVTQRYIHGTAVGVENFTMADLDGLGYAMFPNWMNGFSYLRVENGRSYITPVPMTNNTFMFNGKIYTPKGVI